MITVIDLKRIQDLGGYPIMEAEAKEKCRVTSTDDDSEFTKLIRRATRMIENRLNISIVYQRIQLIARWGEIAWSLPYGPVIGIESVMDSQIGTGSGPVTYATRDTWESDEGLFDPGGCARVKVVYTAGMETVPDDLKELVLEVVSFLYENRAATAETKEVRELIMGNGSQYFVSTWI